MIMKKRLLVFIGIILTITIGGFMMKSFIFGGEIRAGAIGLVKANVNETEIRVSGDFILESSKAYKNYRYRIDGNNVYIKIYGTLVSSIYRYGAFDISIKGDFSLIENVYLEGHGEETLIWNNFTGLE
jgi:uncharacterized protein YxeA